jgi:hypothetical protein
MTRGLRGFDFGPHPSRRGDVVVGSERLDGGVWELIGGARWPLMRGEEVGFGRGEAWAFSWHLYIG